MRGEGVQVQGMRGWCDLGNDVPRSGELGYGLREDQMARIFFN